MYLKNKRVSFVAWRDWNADSNLRAYYDRIESKHLRANRSSYCLNRPILGLELEDEEHLFIAIVYFKSNYFRVQAYLNHHRLTLVFLIDSNCSDTISFNSSADLCTTLNESQCPPVSTPKPNSSSVTRLISVGIITLIVA